MSARSRATRGPLLEYSFQVALPDSHYKLKLGTTWGFVAYSGSFQLDPETADLVQMTVVASDLPLGGGGVPDDYESGFPEGGNRQRAVPAAESGDPAICLPERSGDRQYDLPGELPRISWRVDGHLLSRRTGDGRRRGKRFQRFIVAARRGPIHDGADIGDLHRYGGRRRCVHRKTRRSGPRRRREGVGAKGHRGGRPPASRTKLREAAGGRGCPETGSDVGARRHEWPSMRYAIGRTDRPKRGGKAKAWRSLSHCAARKTPGRFAFPASTSSSPPAITPTGRRSSDRFRIQHLRYVGPRTIEFTFLRTVPEECLARHRGDDGPLRAQDKEKTPATRPESVKEEGDGNICC